MENHYERHAIVLRHAFEKPGRSFSSAWIPPADAPMPTTGKSRVLVIVFLLLSGTDSNCVKSIYVRVFDFESVNMLIVVFGKSTHNSNAIQAGKKSLLADGFLTFFIPQP